MLHSAWLRIVVVALWPLPQLLIGQHPFTSAGSAIAAAAYTLCLAGKLYGCGLFTRPDPEPPLKAESLLSARRLYRTLSAIDIGAFALTVPFVINIGGPVYGLVVLLLWTSVIAWLLSLVAFALYAGTLLPKLRVPSTVGSPRTMWAVWLAILIFLGPVMGLGVLIVVAMFALQLQAIISGLRAVIKAQRVLDFPPASDQAPAP